MSEQIKPGTLVRANGVIWRVLYRETDEEGRDYVICDAPQIGSYGHDFDIDAVSFVATAEEAKSRRLPTKGVIQRLVMGLCGRGVEGFEIDEAAKDGETDVLLYGKTDLDQRVGIRLRIVAVTEEDF